MSSGPKRSLRSRLVEGTTVIACAAKSIVTAWPCSVSIPTRPAAPRLRATSAGASIPRADSRAPASGEPIRRSGMTTVANCADPAIAVTWTLRPGARPSLVASSRAITVRSAPVSTTKRYGPAGPIVTGTVMRRPSLMKSSCSAGFCCSSCCAAEGGATVGTGWGWASAAAIGTARSSAGFIAARYARSGRTTSGASRVASLLRRALRPRSAARRRRGRWRSSRGRSA